MRSITIILLIASFVARYRADYESCAANATSSSHVYGQQCYQVFGSRQSQLTHTTAKQECQAQKGNLAVVIGDVLRQKLAGIIQMMLGSEALVALLQITPSSGGGIADNWFWAVDDKLQLATSDSENKVAWNEPDEPNDPGNEEQYGALMTDGHFKDSADSFSFYICQFRKEVATFGMYGKDQSMTVAGQNGGIVDGVSLGACAIGCYADPSCMAFNYMNDNGVCNKQLVRPQEADVSALQIEAAPGTGIWVKE